MTGVADVLMHMRESGVQLWTENGRLHYKAPKGALDAHHIETLRAAKGQIVALLEKATGMQPHEMWLESPPRLARAPLAFSQQAHWYLAGLNEQPAIRQIVSATRLRGRLNIDALQRSAAEIVRRHDALRTRIVVVDGAPTQEVAASSDCDLTVRDLTSSSIDSREAEVCRIIERLILEPIDVAVGPLSEMQLIRLREDEHVLVIVMEHLVSDAFSMNILTRELFACYVQASNGRAFSLPEIPVQLCGYAIQQRNMLPSWIERHGGYWSERLAGSRRLRFPADRSMPVESPAGWGDVPIRIGKDLKNELREWCRLKRTTLVMSVLTAYAGFVLRWCEAREVVLQHQTDGRVSPRLENTIGYLASVIFLRLQCLETDNFVDLLNRVTDEYCRAYEHADSSYLVAKTSRPEFARNTAFNWVPQGSRLDLSGLDESQDAIQCSPFPFAHPMLRTLERDNEPVVLFYDTEEEIVGGVQFPLNRFSTQLMERFSHDFLSFITALLRTPEARMKDIVLT